MVLYGTVWYKWLKLHMCRYSMVRMVLYSTVWYKWLKLYICRIACVLFVLLCVAGACIASLVWWINDETSGLSR